MRVKIDIVQFIKQFLHTYYPNKYTHVCNLRKWTIDAVIKEIIYFISVDASYKNARTNIPSKTLFNYISFFKKNCIFKKVYSSMLNKYFTIRKINKFLN